MKKAPVRSGGLFITFEGGEGTGKSTQARLLHEHLAGRGIETILTREPGGTACGERLRRLLLDPGVGGLDPLSELLLMEAARREHVEQVIKPALAAGATVITDRFADASLAYQGYGRGLDLRLIRRLNSLVCAGLRPQATVLLHFAAAPAGLERARRRDVEAGRTESEGRFEREEAAFHVRVVEGYLALASREPRRFLIVGAEGKPEDIHGRVLAALMRRFPRRGWSA